MLHGKIAHLANSIPINTTALAQERLVATCVCNPLKSIKSEAFEERAVYKRIAIAEFAIESKFVPLYSAFVLFQLALMLPSDEQRLFDGLRDYLDTYRYSPSIEDLETFLGYRSRSDLQTLLQQLRKKGYIDWQPRKARTYRVLVRGVPILGVIQAGVVIEHGTDWVEWADWPGLPYRSNLYALRVCGDSMINAHVCDGDLVVLRPKPDLWSLRRDAIVAVWVDGEGTTLKHIAFDGKHVFLHPANQNYATRKLTPEQIELQGVVVSVHRYWEFSV